jgi:hypothetical protein
MYNYTTEMLQARAYDQAQCCESGSAANLYTQIRRDARRRRFWLSGSRHSRRLLELSKIEGTCRIDARCYAGLHTVPMEQIRGSEGRSNDFDRSFRPLQDHCMSRWLRIAAAYDQDKVLPPVVLVRVGDVYFVRDGHHRISVARALGQLEIEAEVTVWRVSGPLPWETQVGKEKGCLNQRTEDAGPNKVLKSGPVALWLRSLLLGRFRTRSLTPASSRAAA